MRGKDNPQDAHTDPWGFVLPLGVCQGALSPPLGTLSPRVKGSEIMPPWIIAALRLLGTGLAFGAGTEIATRQFEGGPIQFASGIGEAAAQGRASAVVHPLTGHDIVMHRRRRRRRRALTASDKADIAFIAGILGKAAGGRFAVALGARAR